MTRLLQVKPHVRRAPVDPHAAERAAMTERLRRYVAQMEPEREREADVDRQITASLKTFALNVWRAVKAGRI
jgi:hypothetical protein